MLVVIFIIMILSAIAFPPYQRAVDKANFARADAVARQLAQYVEWYYLEYGEYPKDWTKMNFSIPGCTARRDNFTCPDIKFEGGQIGLTLDSSKEFFYFFGNSFRNMYYFLHTQRTYRGQWKCNPLTNNSRMRSICKNLCGVHTCYYK